MKIGQDELSQQPKLSREMLIPQVDNCPSCLEFLPQKATECPACGILLSNFKRVSLEKRLKITIPALMHLNSYECEALDKEWEKVSAAYASRDTHDRFLQYCYQRDALPYAVHQYQQLWVKDVSDDLAEYMMRRAKTLADGFMWTSTDDRQEDYLWNPSLMRLFTYVLYFAFFVGIFFTGLSLVKLAAPGLLIFSVTLMGASVLALQALRQQYKF